MGNKSHILDFTSKTKSVRGKEERRPLPALVERARSICSQALDQSLKNMFEQADDCLFDMSENGYNNAHFDAMRMLRLKKEGLIKSFHEEVETCFSDNIGKFDPLSSQYDDEGMSFENIALVEDSDLEEGIAIDSIVKKARNANSEALEQIRIRLDTLTSSVSITQENNPFEPAFICSSFKTATLALDMDIESLLVIYKLFERIVIADLPDMYQQINRFFIDKGVLPELKANQTQVKKSTSQVAYNHSYMDVKQEHNRNQLNTTLDEEELIAAQNNAGEQMLSMMQGLLAHSRQAVNDGNHYSNAVTSNMTHARQSAVEIDTNTLLTALTNLQAASVNRQDGAVNIGNQGLKNYLDNQLPASSSEFKNGSLGQFDEDMIDIVSMLFDFILDDKNLHVEIKSIIARLQIPMLKVGLVDRTFFSNKKHPARLLLNEIARAGISWNPNDVEAKRMREKIESLCEEIIINFKDNVSIFEVLLEDFQSFQIKIQRRADIFERRTREAEEGKAKAESARGVVNNELEKICRGRHVPESVRLLLKNVWVNVLFLEKLKENQDGWEKATKIAQLLIWSVQPVGSAHGLDKLISRIPILIKNLRKGFDIVSLSPIEATHILDSLEDTHRAIIKTAQENIEKNSKEEILRLEPAPLIPESTPQKTDENTVVSDKSNHFNQGDNETIEPIDEVIEIQDIGFSSEQLGLPDKQETLTVDLKPGSFQAIESLRAGLWVELMIDDKPMRCKLAAKISSTGKYIFVNRLGVKMAEYYTDSLVAEYQRGRLKIIDDEALFDRALESVISNLRAMKSEV